MIASTSSRMLRVTRARSLHTSSALLASHHPTHSQPLLPSVLRALVLGGVKDTSSIKATGHKGMLTKGDVLAFLGKIKNARGSEKEVAVHGSASAAAAVSEKKVEPLSGPALRSLIAFGLASPPSQQVLHERAALDFYSVLDQYVPAAKKASAAPASIPSSSRKDPFDAVLGL